MKRLASFVALLLILLVFAAQGLGFHPTSLSINQVTQSYPETLWRTLFSSVPRREYAVRNVTLHVESEMLLLLGASSSGKSTILRLVSGQESPVEGDITWNPPETRPIYLDQKPEYDSSQSVGRILTRLCPDKIPQQEWDEVVTLVCETVTLENLEVTPSELSPSALYRFGLARATLQSISPTLSTTIPVASPILLLDEWMDLETSEIIQRVEDSIANLTAHGAVILCVTHKPHLFAKRHRSITLCRGEILSESTV